MKKILTSRIFLIIITAIVCITGTVYAVEEVINAKDIRYKTKTVEDSLNELYIKANAKDVGALKFCKFIDGTYGSYGNIGSKYECDPGDGTKRNFYILAVNNDNTVDLIMDRNLTTVGWDGAMEYFTRGSGRTYQSSWENVLKIGLPDAQAIATAVENANWNVLSSASSYYCLETKSQNISSAPSCNPTGKYAWLYSYLLNCESANCEVGSQNGISDRGYWTSSIISGKSEIWNVENQGIIGTSRPDATSYGIRPVITVLKSNLYSE